jgi:hypothetical protein
MDEALLATNRAGSVQKSHLLNAPPMRIIAALEKNLKPRESKHADHASPNRRQRYRG